MELFKFFGTIAVNNTEANRALDETANNAEKSHSKISNAFSKIGKAAVEVGKVIGKGLIAGSVAMGKLGKDALEAYGDYEQLVGGVETLFGTGGLSIEEYAKKVGKSVNDVKGEYSKLETAQKTVLANADKSYKTAGMSANTYMETVTSFSASLIQSLGGDTTKAAKLADQTIIDMSDNANKMGSSMESIQNAYQGFAKQNYSMLDNLKLGYGGTQQEMFRLMQDAAELDETFAKTADFSIDKKGHLTAGFNDIAQAIHIVQENMGITGTTAKEAEHTIQGSVNMMKASWQNLVTGLADDTQDFDVLMNNFVESVVTVLDNVLPRVEIIVRKIPALIEGIVQQVPGIIQGILPALIEGAITLVNGLVSAMPAVINVLLDCVPLLIDGVMKIMDGLIGALPQIMDSLLSALPELLPQIIDAVIGLIMMIVEMLPDIIQPIVDYLPEVLSSVVDAFIGNLPVLINGLLSAIPKLLDAGIKLLMAIVDAIPVLINNLVPKLPEIIRTVIDGLLNGSGKLLTGAIQLFLAIVKALPLILDTLLPEVPMIIGEVIKALIKEIDFLLNGAIQLFMAILDAIPVLIEALIPLIPSIVETIVNVLIENIDVLLTAAITLLTAIIEAVGEIVVQLATEAPKIVAAIINGVAELPKKISEKFEDVKQKISDKVEAIKTLVSDKFEDIKTKIESPIIKAKETVTNAITKLKDLIGNLKLELPRFKLPHFNISGGKVPWGIGGQGTKPTIGVEWYAKAVGNPMILDKPTIFGVNPSGDLLGGGEAGQEVVSGTGTLMKMISSAVRNENSAVVFYLEKLLSSLNDFLPEIIANVGNDIVLDDGTLVGKITPKIDRQLGSINRMKARGI